MAKRLIETKQGFKLYYDYSYQEYSVKHPTNHNATYFTDDIHDAEGTMECMIKQYVNEGV